MATGGDWNLTDSDIASLAEVIAAESLETIALKYLGIQCEDIENLSREHGDDVQAFNREILRMWAWKNPGPDQAKVLASILYKAARDGGYVNPDKVQQILGMPPETAIMKVPTGAGAHENVTDTEVRELIDELKNYTEEASKTPLVPWVEDYAVNMKDTYVKLGVEKIENKLTGPQFTEIENYAELFEETSDSRNRKGKRKKVLGKGDPGMGKSTFGMKVAFDWAKDIFTAVSIVFLISLKLVRPGDSIESIIIQQTPPVEALGITEQKLRHILETFGNKVLMILDGLDEHDLGRNEDVQKIIEGRKLPCCCILLTSRPHCTEQIERYFPTAVRIDGFTKDQAQLFILNHLKDKDKMDAVLRLNARNFMSKDSAHSCPMLLLFLCVLVNSDELPLKQKVVHLGEIYFRLVRCIYRKYCVRKKIEFEQGHFVDALNSLGKLALDMLQTNEGCARRSKLIKEVGEDSFEYGLLIGQRGFKLLGKETSDIFLSFVHRTIQEFLGTFFLIKSLGDEKRVTNLVKPIFLDNRLFLQFCLWFLSDECEKSFLSMKDRKDTYKAFITVFAKAIDYIQLDLQEVSKVFPSINIGFAHMTTPDDLLLGFIQEVLFACRNTKELYWDDWMYPGDWITGSIRHLLPSLQILGDEQIAEQLPLHELNSENKIAVIGNARRYDDVRNIVKFCEATNKNPSLYLLVDHYGPIELSQFMNSPIEMLYLFRKKCNESQKISVQNTIQLCPFLTQLSIVKMNIDESVLVALSAAVQHGKLPQLKRLTFEACRSSLKGKLSKLFQSIWPQLTNLNLDGCDLDEDDLEVLMDCLSNHENKRLPELTSLVLHSQIPIPRKEPLASITALHLHKTSTESYQSIATSLNQGQLPKLTKLSISMWRHVDRHVKLNTIKAPTLTDLTLNGLIHSRTHLYTIAKSAKCSNLHKLDISHSSGMSGTLFILLCHSFPSLNSLILSDCGLSSQDLCSLAQASAKGRLTKIRHLDISQNPELADQLHNLFSLEQKWQQLLILNTQQNVLSDIDFKILTSQVLCGNLCSLQELWVSAQSTECLLSRPPVLWLNLQQLHVLHKPGPFNTVKILKPIVGANESDLFPNLSKLHLISTGSTTDPMLSFAVNQLDVQAMSKFRGGLQQMSDGFASGQIEKSGIDAVVDLSELIGTELFNHPAAHYRDMGSMLRSLIQSCFQYVTESRSLDLESLLRIMPDELGYNPSVPIPEPLRSIADTLLSNMHMSTKAKPLPGLLRDPTDKDFILKFLLKRRGVRVYRSQLEHGDQK